MKAEKFIVSGLMINGIFAAVKIVNNNIVN